MLPQLMASFALQKHGGQHSQIYGAVLTADTASWFQLINATTAKPCAPSTIGNTCSKVTGAQDAPVQHDSRWLSNNYTKVFCSVTVHLHVYGAKSSSAQSVSAANQLFTQANNNSNQAAKDDLCGDTAVLIASTPDAGVLAASLPC